jgi:hypothetical protein
MLDLVLSADFAGAAELRAQARSVLVVGRCDCGCPSVDLKTGDDTPTARMDSRLVPCELEVVPAGDELPGQVIVFTDDGRLSYLEYAYFDEAPTEWPDPSQVRLIVPPAADG